MPRPVKCRRIGFIPGVNYFKPAGIPLRFLEEVSLSLEEAEAVRLKDIEDLDQEQCAEKMNISRPTFQRVLESARKKIADVLLNGKAIRIEGGNYEMTNEICCFGDKYKQANINSKEGVNLMKIAVVTDNEKTVSQHFGRAEYYMVYTIEDGKIKGMERRDKVGHRHFAGEEGPHTVSHGPHGCGPESEHKHAGMASSISDCQVLIAGGMGMGAYNSMKSYNIEPVVTDIVGIEQAVKLYAEGKLPNLKDRLH